MYTVCKIIARERDERKRAEFRRFTSQFQPEQFLFVDESSKDERTTQCAANIAINIEIVRFSETSACSYLVRGGRAGFEGGPARVSLGMGC